MKKSFRVIALLLVVAAAAFWVAAGANSGFTVNNQPKTIVDPITGLEGTTYEKVFVPGVDFLALALVAAGILTGASFVFRKKTGTQPTIQQSNQQ